MNLIKNALYFQSGDGCKPIQIKTTLDVQI